jgi:chromosome segregation ATPase
MNINLQDLLAIVACILGPIGTLMGFIWQHSNTKFGKLDEKIDNLRVELKEDINSVEKRLDEKIDNLRGELNSVEKRLGEKIDAVRDRVSRIEGQLAPASIVAFNPTRHKESTRATHSS